jgi:tetratricopeptide (TPR) repeat protein
MFEDALAILREFEHMDGIAGILTDLGRNALANDELDEAAKFCKQSLVISRDTHNEWHIINAVVVQAEMARRQWDTEQAARLLAEAMAWRQELGNRDLIAAVLEGQGRVARAQGDHAAARALQLQALALWRESGHPINLAHSFHALALLAAERSEKAERAARLFGAAHPYYPALYAYWGDVPIWRAEHEQGLAAVRAQLGEARAAALMAEGEAMTLQQAYNYALES